MPSTEQPMPLSPSDLDKAAKHLAAGLKATEVDWALEQAGAAPAPPDGSKRQRLRAALEATQQRDGHAGAFARMVELADQAPAMRDARDELLDEIRAAPISPRARIDTGFGEWLEVGVVYPVREVALVLRLEGHETVLPLDRRASANLRRELAYIHRELLRRESQ